MSTQASMIATIALLACLSAGATAQSPPVERKSPDERYLVEGVIEARRNYQVKLEKLREVYLRTQNVEKRKWVDDELLEYHRIAKRAYLLDLEVPPATLTATENIPKANEYYRQAMSYKDQGWGAEHRDNQFRAELLLQHLMTNYSKSDKIALIAYQLGDIYEKWPFQHYRRAATYFERSVQWDPRLGLDGRLRAARIYDHQLDERAKAVQLYRDVTTHDVDPKRLREAKERLEELTR